MVRWNERFEMMTYSILLVSMQIGSNWVLLAMDKSLSQLFVHIQVIWSTSISNWCSLGANFFQGLLRHFCRFRIRIAIEAATHTLQHLEGRGGGPFRKLASLSKDSRHCRARIQAQITLPSGGLENLFHPKHCGFELYVSRAKVSGLNNIISPPRLLFENIAEARIVTSRTWKKATWQCWIAMMATLHSPLQVCKFEIESESNPRNHVWCHLRL